MSEANGRRPGQFRSNRKNVLPFARPQCSWPAGHGTWDYFNATIDDVRIYNRALSPTEVQALYHLGTATIHSN